MQALGNKNSNRSNSFKYRIEDNSICTLWQKNNHLANNKIKENLLEISDADSQPPNNSIINKSNFSEEHKQNLNNKSSKLINLETSPKNDKIEFDLLNLEINNQYNLKMFEEFIVIVIYELKLNNSFNDHEFPPYETLYSYPNLPQSQNWFI